MSVRCFKCQKCGHVAAVCKGRQRCGKCSGEHEYGKCERGAKRKCCNCRGEHSSASRGCEVSKRAAEIQQVKVPQGITYAEAAKKVVVQPDKINSNPVGMEKNKTRSCEGCNKIMEDTLIVGESEFMLFMVDVINCSAQTEKKTKKIKIVKTAEKFLGIKGFGWEEIMETLNGGIVSSQSQPGGSGSS